MCHLIYFYPPNVLSIRCSVKGVGAQNSRSPTLEFIGRLGTGTRILPWTPYGEGGEIKSSKGRLGDNLFLD
jgi:hypothetical protein